MHPVFSEQLVRAYMQEIERQAARASFRASRPPRWRRRIGRRLVSAGTRLMGVPTPALGEPAREVGAPARRAA